MGTQNLCNLGFIKRLYLQFDTLFGCCNNRVMICPHLNFPERIVLQGIIYTDHFYTSVALADELLKQNMHLTGTIQANHKYLPAAIKKGALHLTKHVIKCLCNNKIMVLAWKDKRTVLMLSTKVNNSVSLMERRNGKERSGIMKLNMIIDYTSTMDRVGRSDHFICSYDFLIKSLKWWQKLYFWLLEIGLVNRYLLYKNHWEKNLTIPAHKAFCKSVMLLKNELTDRNEDIVQLLMMRNAWVESYTLSTSFLGRSIRIVECAQTENRMVVGRKLCITAKHAHKTQLSIQKSVSKLPHNGKFCTVKAYVNILE